MVDVLDGRRAAERLEDHHGIGSVVDLPAHCIHDNELSALTIQDLEPVVPIDVHRQRRTEDRLRCSGRAVRDGLGREQLLAVLVPSVDIAIQSGGDELQVAVPI